MTSHNPTESKQKVCLVFACETEQERKREQMSKKMKNVYMKPCPLLFYYLVMEVSS